MHLLWARYIIARWWLVELMKQEVWRTSVIVCLSCQIIAWPIRGQLAQISNTRYIFGRALLIHNPDTKVCCCYSLNEFGIFRSFILKQNFKNPFYDPIILNQFAHSFCNSPADFSYLISKDIQTLNIHSPFLNFPKALIFFFEDFYIEF